MTVDKLVKTRPPTQLRSIATNCKIIIAIIIVIRKRIAIIIAIQKLIVTLIAKICKYRNIYCFSKGYDNNNWTNVQYHCFKSLIVGGFYATCTTAVVSVSCE